MTSQAKVKTRKAGLDPELLALSGGSLIPGSYYLDPPAIDEATGALNQISYDNAAMELRPSANTSIIGLTNETVVIRRRGLALLDLAKKRHVIPADTTISLIPAAPLRPVDAALESVSQFGCSPAQSVTSGFQTTDVRPNVSAANTLIRSAGFHIHHEVIQGSHIPGLIACLDATIGLLDVIQNSRMGWTTASRMRRTVLGYGRAGEFRARPNPIGDGSAIVEYRTMSPWVMARERYMFEVISVMRIFASLKRDVLVARASSYPIRQYIMESINKDKPAMAYTMLLSVLDYERKHGQHVIARAIEAVLNQDLPS